MSEVDVEERKVEESPVKCVRSSTATYSVVLVLRSIPTMDRLSIICEFVKRVGDAVHFAGTEKEIRGYLQAML